ncbi:MAG: hypothetical protein KJ638_05825 [Chloroflexi bacterium]|nr:hypothetical protein [Chloroflexota bacterium]
MTEPPPPKDKQPTPACSCVQDPFASLPPELQPKNKTWKSGFRHVTCPRCGQEYWTNCEGDLCTGCQKKGIQIPQTETPK